MTPKLPWKGVFLNPRSSKRQSQKAGVTGEVAFLKPWEETAEYDWVRTKGI